MWIRCSLITRYNSDQWCEYIWILCHIQINNIWMTSLTKVTWTYLQSQNVQIYSKYYWTVIRSIHTTEYQWNNQFLHVNNNSNYHIVEWHDWIWDSINLLQHHTISVHKLSIVSAIIDNAKFIKWIANTLSMKITYLIIQELWISMSAMLVLLTFKFEDFWAQIFLSNKTILYKTAWHSCNQNCNHTQWIIHKSISSSLPPSCSSTLWNLNNG